jgi:hypothetical protein
MADPHKEKRDRATMTAMSRHEAEAQILREKTARLRALRLAHEAANGSATTAAAPSVGRTAVKKKTGKTREKAPSLSDWLASQQNQGRRS